MFSEAFKGNLTTVIKFVVMTVATGLGVDMATSDALVSVLVAVVFFILAYFDAKYPNTFLDEGNVDCVSGDLSGEESTVE